MKRLTVFLLTLVLLVSFSICVGSDIAFARNHGSTNGSTSAAAVVILDCVVAPPTVLVAGFSPSENPPVPLVAGTDQCALDLAALINAGFKIKNVQTVNTTDMVYTLISTGTSSDGPDD